MKRMKVGIVLLALLLAAMAMVPMVNADQIASSGSNVDVSKIQLPSLQFDNTSKKVVVTGELDPVESVQTAQVNAQANNYLQPDTPVNEYQYSGMITIDPVGNHTPGDVIPLHGTADLPSGTTLLVETMLLNCRVGACARSEDNGFPVVINGSPGKNTWSYQLNTTGFWTVDWNGNRWVYQICVNSWNSTLGDISPPCDYMSLFNQSESVPAPENTNLNISGQSGLPPISSVSTPQTNAQEGLSAPVYAVVPVAAAAIAGLVLFRNRNK